MEDDDAQLTLEEESADGTSGDERVTSIVRRPVSRRGHRYSQDELESFVRTARQKNQLGQSWTDAAKEMGLAWPTLRKALQRSGVDIGSRGRRPRLAPSRRGRATSGDVHPRVTGSGTQLTVRVDAEQFVADNRDLIVDLLLKGRREGIQTAVRELLG